MTTDPLAAIRATFFMECEELLEGLQDALNAMSDGRGDTEAINIVFRAVHSIKGGAGAFGFDALVGFAHRLETVLDHLRAGRVQPTADMVKHLFLAADLLQDHVRAAREGAAPPSGEAALRMLEGDAIVEDAGSMIDFTPATLSFDDLAPVPHGPRWWTIRFTPHARLYTSGNEALLVLRTLSALGRAIVACDIPDGLSLADDAAEQPRLSWRIDLEAEADRAEIEEVFDFVADICEVEIAEGHDIHAAPAGKREDATDARPAPAHVPPPTPEPTTIRVDLQKIDRLVNLVGELVINQAMLSQSIGQTGLGNARIAAGLEAFLTLTRDLQDSVMSVRAQPVKPLFQRMARVVREASAGLGKEVRLKTEGEATEVDRTVIERLAEPLTHMIRNAMDHGLEDPPARLAAGKPLEGQITLSAIHRADRIVIEVADDGAGIDRRKVLATARDRGLLAMDAVPTPVEADNLMFLPGFSTSAGISTLSGRGVGMDVVKCAVTALGGRISVTSEPGLGTTFSLSLPLTLAVLDGLVIQTAGQTFVVPLSAIVETAALGTAAIRKVGPDTELLQVRGKLVPVIDLGTRLGFRHTATHRRNGIVLLTGQDDGPGPALIVDAVLEQRQVVIKGLGPGIERIPGVAAATILGDGRIALILDPAGLTQTSGNADIALAG